MNKFSETLQEWIGIGLALVLPSTLLLVPILHDWGVQDFKFRDAVDRNITLKEFYYEERPEDYRLHYTDWKQFEDDRK